MRRKRGVIIGIAAILILAGVGLGIAAFSAENVEDDSLNIYFEGKKQSERGFLQNDEIYVPVSVLEKHGSIKGITIDEKSLRMNLDISSWNLLMADDITTQFIKNNLGQAYIPLRKLGASNAVCYPVSATSQFCKISAAVNNRGIQLHKYASDNIKMAKVNKDGAGLVPSLMREPDPESELTLQRGDTVFISDETEHYYLIETYDGTLGYVMKGDITVSDIDLSNVDFYAPRKTKLQNSGSEKLSLVWLGVEKKTPAAPESKFGGIDIMSPTWFDLIVDGEGATENNGDRGFVDACHKKGYKVWATITNNMSKKGSTSYTTKTLADPKLMNRSIAQYLFYSCLYDADGINIDYESVADGDRNALINFTSALRVYTERQGLNLSIDVSVPSSWSIEFDRKSLAKHVDWLCVMTYDQHWSGSTTAGSVSSNDWAESCIKATLEEGVPANKLLMGVPLYTRVWTTDASGKVVRNAAATMNAIDELLAGKNVNKTWDSTAKQYYVIYPNGVNSDQIWIEDERSIANRLELVRKYNLAGTGSWQYLQGREGAWNVYEQMLKKQAPLSEFDK